MSSVVINACTIYVKKEKLRLMKGCNLDFNLNIFN